VKRISIVLVLAMALVLAFSGVAYANFGAHGGYSQDTDACAGCHRAHTSFSEVEWVDQYDNEHSALLVSSASTMEEFCYACHGDLAPGASTNVEEGIFDAGPSGADAQVAGDDNDGVLVAYETNSVFDADLNGGAFEGSSSMHDMGEGAATDPMWGDGLSAPEGKNLTCTDCHDPHGSSNYRLLKDSVNDNVVGGYTNDVPTPYVISAEEGYPVGGWLKHEAGASQLTTYFPNYTAPEYAYQAPLAGQFRSMSTWCSACHERYDDKNDVTDGVTYDYGEYESYFDGSTTTEVGPRARHRHPVNITLAAGVGATRALVEEVITSTVLPLEMSSAKDSADFRGGNWDFQDYMGCLTCHFAHGTSVEMTGWAEAYLATDASAVVTWYPGPTGPGSFPWQVYGHVPPFWCFVS
jgi:cytochrome c553